LPWQIHIEGELAMELDEEFHEEKSRVRKRNTHEKQRVTSASRTLGEEEWEDEFYMSYHMRWASMSMASAKRRNSK